MVGEEGNEYVSPSDGLANPTLLPFLGTLEAARRNGALRNIDFGAIYSPMMTVAGRAAGGFTSSEPESSSAAAAMPSNREIIALLEEIIDKLDDPVPAVVAMLGPHGFVEQLKKYEKSKKRGKL